MIDTTELFVNVNILSGCSCSGKTDIFNKVKNDYNYCNFNDETAKKIIKRRYNEGRLVPYDYNELKHIHLGDMWKGFLDEIHLEQKNEIENILNKSVVPHKSKSSTIFLIGGFEDTLAYTKVHSIEGSNYDFKDTKAFIKSQLFHSWERYNRYTEDYTVRLNFNVFIYQSIKEAQVDNRIKTEHDFIVDAYKQNFTDSELHIEENPQTVDERYKQIIKYII